MAEPLVVGVGDPRPRREQLVEAAQLRQPDGGEDVGEAVVEAGLGHVGVGERAPAVVAEPRDLGGDPLVVGRDRAALAGGDDLARVEAEARRQPERAARAAAPAARRARRRRPRSPAGRAAPRSGRAGRRGARRGSRSSAARPRSSRDRCSSSPGRRRRARARARRARPRSRSRGRCRRGRAPRRPARARGRARRGGAPPCPTRRRSRGVVSHARASSCSSSATTRALGEHPALEHLRHRVGLVRARVGPREADPLYLARYHSIVLERPSSSSTRGSQPSSSRAFSTFGMRSSTST